MPSEFMGIRYIGGLSDISKSIDVLVIIDKQFRRLILKSLNVSTFINFEDILEVSLNEKSTRSAGGAATGAIVGGVLSGGIGLLAGAALGGRKRDASTIYITHKKYDKPTDLLLKAGWKTNDLYAALSSAIIIDAPADFDDSRTNYDTSENAQKIQLTTGGCISMLIIVGIIWLILRQC